MNARAGAGQGVAAGATCRSCGASLAGRYCHDCGQPSAAAPRSLCEVLSGPAGRLMHTLRIEHRFQTLYTLFVPAVALGYGGLIGVLHWRRKPWPVPLAGGIQYLCFVYLWLGLLLAVARAAGVNPYGYTPVQIIAALVGIGYATLTIRRIYDERWLPAASKGIVTVLGGAGSA